MGEPQSKQRLTAPLMDGGPIVVINLDQYRSRDGDVHGSCELDYPFILLSMAIPEPTNEDNPHIQSRPADSELNMAIW